MFTMKMKRVSLAFTVAILSAGLGANRVSAELLTVATTPGGLTITVDGTNYTAPVKFDWAAGSLHTLDTPSPQVAGDGHSRANFAAWSDGEAQSHSITVVASDSTNTASFATQYLLDIAVTPSGAGTVTNNPLGPWYDAGQLVSLTAMTNTGYRIYYWQGVDSAASNTAQVTMNGYHLVQASFIPSDYPYIVVTNNGGAAPGDLIGSLGGRTADGTKLYYVVLDNTGTNALFASKTNSLSRFVTPQGFDAVPGGGVFSLKDETLGVVDSFKTLGYTLDTHDMKLLPNGHALVFGTEVRTIDMSALVPGGKTAASVTGDVIQEIDANKRLVFEWHTFDHIPITNSFYDLTQQSIDYAHMNAVSIDPTDNHLLVSLRTTSEIVKINRQTGEVMWRLGGKANQFTFIREHEENAPYYTVGQHDIHRLANGNLLYFDNGNISGGGITPNDRTYSRAVEYQLDEHNMTATLAWEYRHSPDISAPCTGAVKRFVNGNTLIDWGCAIATSGTILTEVSPAGNVVLEMQHPVKGPSSSLTKQVWNSPDLVRGTNYEDIVAGQTYSSPAAGVSVTVNSLSGLSQNELLVQRRLDAVRFPEFSGKAPQVVMEHIVLSGSNIVAWEAELDLDLPDTSYVFDTPMIFDPAQVVVYQRPTPGQGQFSALPTTYYAATKKLRVTTPQLGEFILAYPDLAETPYLPAILSPADQSEVNQAAPVTMTWTPRGLVASFDLQVATNAGFANLVLATNNLGSGSYVLQDPLPNTQYFWRVRVVNQGGTSDWATASFTTVPPMLHLTYPAGGETWQRFRVVTIRWVDNLSENVALDIYKGGVSNRNFVASTPSTGAYTWTVGQYQAFPPGSDYTLKIRSTANPALYDFSPPFSMITNLASVTINSGSVTNLPNGSVQFGFSIPGAIEATVMGSTNLLNWEALQTVPLTNGSAVFTDDTATSFSCRFYRLRVP
jgi:Arylsulfotransferase (ASST)/Divergent InlB B-repeat domain/Ser-Thr-rich glycosyl-phosphatidyl-inositol-anchored membrane family